MAHGQPDFGIYAAKETITGLADLGELAARLGSIVRFSRSGDVVWYDEFDGEPNKWFVHGTGTDNSQDISAELAFVKSASMKLVGGKTGTHLAYMQKSLAYPKLSKFGFEFAWNLGSVIDTLTMTLAILSAAGMYTGIIRYNYSTRTLEYYTEPTTYVELTTGIYIAPGGNKFNIWKLVVDMSTKKYVKFTHNDTEYPMTDLALDESPAPYIPEIFLEVKLTSRNGENDYIYGGYAIVTQNEP